MRSDISRSSDRRAERTIVAGLAAVVLLVAASASAGAQQPPQASDKPAAKKASPVGTPAGWDPKVQKSQAPSVTGTTLDPAKVEAVQKVSAYFNAMLNLKGVFLQTTDDKKQSKGRFYVKRPGRFRFDYAAPSKLRILSDGTYFSIEDHDIKTVDDYLLTSTPFRLLLSKNVDILRDAHVLDVQESPDLIIVSMKDKSPNTAGRITVYLSKAPQLELKEWVIVDAQGSKTRIEVAKLITTEELNPKLFVRSRFGLKGPQGD
ncbi:MAG: outer-membrane lipoprotein carrier protein LolA [Hyphomicrobiaceae bacterium]|nr:outer-membrane lipoprotein carrier protein LolA [Hyphomicrobiaceae bacterium]